ncbi:hypothetical protein GX50_04214 [[Emmonsia] crescens]|uniref:Uncharacterized protein n=1 Tax=[Emmonsia] crescens TaxID=73230 RepID=A0A2B7ZII6_9EURO|nr:hypothetical protein GX50_04214 [Emmonsia crescens]
MVVTPKLYPRATVKRIVKAHSRRNISKNADILTTCSSYKSRNLPSSTPKVIMIIAYEIDISQIDARGLHPFEKRWGEGYLSKKHPESDGGYIAEI